MGIPARMIIIALAALATGGLLYLCGADRFGQTAGAVLVGVLVTVNLIPRR